MSGRSIGATERASAVPDAHVVRRVPPVLLVGGILTIVEAGVLFEHARRLLAHIVLAEETLGLSALSPLGNEVVAGVLEVLAAVMLILALIAVARRSRLALVFIVAVQAVVAVDGVLRVLGGLPGLITVALLVLAGAIATAMVSRPSRAWCDQAIRVTKRR